MITRHSTTTSPRRARLAVPATASALAAGLLAAAAMGSAPEANASCFSAFGLGASAACTSTLFSVAFALGTNAEAHADGLFGAAFTVGDASYAETKDAFSFGTNFGTNGEADGDGLFGIAISLGNNGQAVTLGSGKLGNLGFNIAVNISQSNAVPTGTVVYAAGIGNVAVNLFGGGTNAGSNQASALGTGNFAAIVGGKNNTARAGNNVTGGTLDSAFVVFGKDNNVTADPGPLAVAGSIGQTGQTITKSGPGIHINGVKVGGASAVHPKSPPAAAQRAQRGSARR